MKKTVIALLLIGTLFLSACNTMRGIGEDVETAGQKIQKSTR